MDNHAFNVLKTHKTLNYVICRVFMCFSLWIDNFVFVSGNGKRSGPPTDLSKNIQNDQLLLKKILLQNSDFNNYGIGNFDLSPSEPLEEQSSGNNGLEDLKTLSDLIQELVSLCCLILQKKMRMEIEKMSKNEFTATLLFYKHNFVLRKKRNLFQGTTAKYFVFNVFVVFFISLLSLMIVSCFVLFLKLLGISVSSVCLRWNN